MLLARGSTKEPYHYGPNYLNRLRTEKEHHSVYNLTPRGYFRDPDSSVLKHKCRCVKASGFKFTRASINMIRCGYLNDVVELTTRYLQPLPVVSAMNAEDDLSGRRCPDHLNETTSQQSYAPVDINQRCSYRIRYRETALISACRVESILSVHSLLHYGADPNVESGDTGSPLMYAIVSARDCRVITSLLVAFGASTVGSNKAVWPYAPLYAALKENVQ